MATREEARKYLERALAEAGASWKEASAEVGKNDAYIQQYIRDGKPKFLDEEIRLALVERWPSIDPERLKPDPSPPRSRAPTAGKRQHQAQIYPPGYGKVVQEARTIELLDTWEAIKAPDLRDLVLRTAHAMLELDKVRAA